MQNKSEMRITPERIRKITQSVIGLPTLPTVVSKMLRMIDSPKTSASTLARLISTDQALTAKVLKLANSAYYGFPREISTVNMAIVVLGFNTVKDMGLWLSVFDVFKNSSVSAGSFDAVRFWEHSAACGVAARMLARNNRSRYSGEAFVAGLLHDMGKIILNQYFSSDFLDVLREAENSDLDSAEKSVLGTGHGQIGSWLAEKWNLPAIIADTIENHHQPWNAKTDASFVATVTVADLLCHLSETGNSGRLAAPVYDERLWDIFSKAGMPIDEPDLEQLQAEFLVEFDKSEAYISLMQDNADLPDAG
ncbi:MAG: HDOD domain-containing protein [Chitinispirillaceae bacterium]